MVHILIGAASSEGFKVALKGMGPDKKERVISFEGNLLDRTRK